jgi:hypothetical protein
MIGQAVKRVVVNSTFLDPGTQITASKKILQPYIDAGLMTEVVQAKADTAADAAKG